MLEQVTLDQVLIWLFSAGGIAVLLQRIPGWDAWQSPKFKAAIVFLLNFLAPAVLAAIKVYVPPEWMNQTVAQLFLGGAMAAAAFVLHMVDQWLIALTVRIKRAVEWPGS